MLDRPDFSPRQRIVDIVVQILAKHSISRAVLPDDDLREIGLSSLDMVNLMLAVEAKFDIEIPESDMTPANFRSVSAIEVLVGTLLQAK